jgi:hypothetical protein
VRRTEIFDNLIEIAKRIFDRVEVTNGDFSGGICRVRSEKCLIINRNVSLDANIKVVSTAIASANLDDQYILPVMRDAIERFSDS